MYIRYTKEKDLIQREIKVNESNLNRIINAFTNYKGIVYVDGAVIDDIERMELLEDILDFEVMDDEIFPIIFDKEYLLELIKIIDYYDDVSDKFINLFHKYKFDKFIIHLPIDIRLADKIRRAIININFHNKYYLMFTNNENKYYIMKEKVKRKTYLLLNIPNPIKFEIDTNKIIETIVKYEQQY